jgi:hypothetical protein
LLTLIGGCNHELNPSVEPPLWACQGVIVDDASGQPLDSVQVWVRDFPQTTSDSSGAYFVALGFSRDAVDSIRFYLENYHASAGLPDTASVIADRTLQINARMIRLKDDHIR